MAGNSIKFNIDFNANTSGINQAKKALEQLRNLTAKDIAIFNNTGMDDEGLKKARALLLEITQESGKAQKAMEAAFNQKLNTVNMQKFKEELIKSGTSLENLRKTLGQAGPIGEKAFTEMSAGLANVKYQTVQTTTFLDKMSASLQRTLTTFISMNIINKVKGSINEAYGYVKNLDTSLNEIRIVTGKSADEMDKFAEKANKAAASLGKATTDYTKASTIFYQQGLSDTEVGARTDVTIKASNTTGQDTKAMADNLTALWNGFNVGAEDAEIYVDRLAALAATTASNLDELTTAMSKTASMANVMGVSEEQLAAQISTVVSVTRQAPESVGTAFKTIYSRISDISAGAEEAETTLGNYSSKLAAMGINVLDSAGKLRDMGDVIEEVGGKWTNYSREQQVAIAGIMGGQRQVNQITALFDNWNEYTKSIETMADAEGTLQKQQDVYMESAEGQLQKLRTEWEGVLDSLLSSDDIIKVAKAIQPIFTSLEKVIDAFGGGVGILTKFSPLLFGLVSPKISEGIAKIGMSFENTKINAEIAKSEVEGFQNQLNQKIGEGAELSGYTKQVQDLINKYGELSKTMSVEQKNQFKESLASLIENEGPKATKQLENYQNKVKEIRSLEIGKDNKILKDVIDAQDEKAIENYQNKIEDLQKTLSQPINKDNLEQVKKQIQDTLGDSDIAKKLIQDLELGTAEVNFSGLAEKIEDVFQNIDTVNIQEKANEIFGEGTKEAEKFAKGVERVRDLEQQILISEERMRENQAQYAAAEEELNKIKENKAQLTKQIQQKEDEITKQTENQQELLKQYNADNIEALKDELRIKQESGEIDVDLMTVISQYEAYQKKIDEASQSINDLNKQTEEQNKRQKENQQAYAEAQQMEQSRIELIREHRKEIEQIQGQLKNGALTEEEANQLIAESTKKVSDEMENLKDRLGETAAELRGVKEQSAETSAEIMSLQQSFEEIKKINFAQHFMDIAQAGVALYSAFQSLIELGNIWDDDDLTQGEKIAQTFTILGTVIPIVVSSVSSGVAAFKALTSEEAKSAIASVGKAVALGVETIAAKIAKKSIEGLTVAEAAATLGAGPLIASMGAIIGIVIAMGAAIFVAVKAIQKWQKEHKTSTENLKEANEELQKATDKYNEMKSAISDYKDAKKGLDELKKGTVEYAEAVTDLNTKVLDLVEKYPELKKFMTVGENGVLEISDEGLEEFQKKQKEELDEASRNAIAAGVNTDQDRRNLSKKYNIDAVDAELKDKEYYLKAGYLTSEDLKELEATKAAYEAELEAMHKSDISLMTSYAKTFEGLTKQENNALQVVIDQLWIKYDGDIEKIKEAIADTEGMLELLSKNNKINDYFKNKKDVSANILDVLNGDYSSVSGKDARDIKLLTQDQMSIDVLAQQMYGEVTEETRKKITDSLLEAAEDIENEIKQLPTPLAAWVARDDMDLSIAEKFVGVGENLADATTKGMTKGVNSLQEELEKQLEGKGFEQFTDLLSSFDWSQDNAWDNFLQTLEEIGIKIENMPSGIKNWADAMSLLGKSVDKSTVKIDNLITASGEISKLKYGSELSTKNFEELTAIFPEVSGYFDKIGDKYRFTATNIEGVNKEIDKSFKESLENLKNYQQELANSNLNNLDIQTWQSQGAKAGLAYKEDGQIDKDNEDFGWEEFNKNAKNNIKEIAELDEQVLNNLQGYSAESVKVIADTFNKTEDLTEEQYNTYMEILNQLGIAVDDLNNKDLIDEKEDQIIAIRINTLEELDSKMNQLGYDEEAIARNRTKIRNKELQELGVSEEAYKNYLRAIGEPLSKINDTEIMIKFKIDLNGKKAAEDIGKIFNEITEKTNEVEKAMAQSNFQKILKDSLDIDLGFFNNEENFDLFGKMIGGDEESEKELKDRLLRMQETLTRSAELALAAGNEERATEIQEEAKKYDILIEYIDDYSDYFKKSAEERLNDIKKQSLELQKQQAEFARSQTQRSISKVENKMAHATGDDWVKLYNQRKQLRKQEIADAKQIMKLDEDLLNSEKKRFNETEKNVQFSADQISHFIDEEKTLEEIIEITHAEGEDISLVESLVKSIIAANQTRIQQEQEIADLEEEQAGTLASIYEVRAATTSKSRNQSQKNIQSEISQIDTQMASATGEDWVKLYNKRKQLQDQYIKGMHEEKQNLKDIEDSNKASLSILGNKIKFDEQGYAIAVDEKNMTTDELDLMSTYNDSLTDRLDMEQQITDEEETQKGILANKYDIEAATTDKSREREKTNTQNEISRIEDAMAHATGKAYIDLQKQRQDAEQKYLKILEEESEEAKDFAESKKEELVVLGDKITYDEKGYAIAVDGAEITTKELEKINEYNDALDDQLDKEQQITDEKRKQYGILLDSLAQIDSGYDESEAEKDLDRREEKADEILRTADPNSKEYKDALAEKEKIRGERYILAKSERDDFAKENKIEIDEEGNITTQYTNELKEAGITVDEKTGRASLEVVKQEVADDLKISVEDLMDMEEEELITMAKENGHDETWAKEWYDRIDLIKKNNEAIDTYYEKDKKIINLENSYKPTWSDDLVENIEASQNKISSLDNQIEQKKKEIANANDSDKAALIEELNELEKQKEEEQEILEGYFAEQQTENVGKVVNSYTGLREGIKTAIDKAKDEGQEDIAESLSEVYKNFSDKTDEELKEGLNALIEEKGSLLTEKDLEDFFGFDKLDDATKKILRPLIDNIMATKDAQEDLNEETKKFALPYDEFEAYDAKVDVHNQKQNQLNDKLKAESSVLSELQAEASLLYGDDLIANLEAQEDSIRRTIELQKEQIELDKEEIKLQEEAIENAETKKTTAKGILEGYIGKDIDINDYLLENGKVDSEKLSKKLGITLSPADIDNINVAIKAYNDAIVEGASATEALAAANQKLTDDTNELNESTRNLLATDKQEYETKLKLAEDVITRETNAQHKLTKALRDTEKALSDVQRAQNGLTGPALISKLQEEIQLQLKKKQILEQQLLQIQQQIKALLDLYNVQLSQRFGVNVGFKVDEHGVANLDELYGAVDKVDEKLRGEYMQFIQQYSSTLNGLSSSALSVMDSIDSMTDSIEDLNKKIKETEMDNLFKTHEEKWNAEEQQLKRISRELNKISKEQSKLSGNALIANLDAQQKMLDKQIEAQKRKLDLMKAELQTMQAMLAMQGVMFDADGLIANYAQVFAKGDEKVNGYMQAYQQLYDSIMDLEDGIQETYDKKADLEAQKTQERLRMFNAKIDVELDLAKAKREWQNFKREFLNTLNGAAELNDNILEKTKQNMKDIYDITTKDVTLLTDHVNKIISEIHLMQGGGTSSLYGTDQQTALSDLANYRQQIQESLSSLQDKMKQVNDAYLQQLDKIKSKFDDQLSNYELIHQIISHDMNIIKILRGDQAYEELARYYDKAAANYEQQIQFLRKQVDYWKNLMDEAVVGSEKWEKFQQNWKDALSKLYSAVDSAMDNIVSKYDAKINAIFNKLRKGTNLDWKLEKWDLDKQLSDMFLDKVSTEYSLQKLQRAYLKKAAEYEDEPALRQEVLDLMQEKLEKYRALSKEAQRNGRLTEREVELANKQFELEMKRLELRKAEEQMTDKTQMRLRRDSRGDYRYEYVAKQNDEDKQKVEDLRDEILDLTEEIRLYAEETRREVTDNYMSAVQTIQDKIRQAMEDLKNNVITPEEYQEKIAYYESWLEQIGEATSTQYNFAAKELTSATLDEMELLGQRAIDDIYKLSQPVYATIEELYPVFGDAFDSLDNVIKETSEGLKEAISEFPDLLNEMEAEIYAIGDAAGLSFDMIIDGTDETIDAMYQLIDDNYELLDQYDQELNQIEALIDELERLQDAYRDVYDAAMEAVDAALELREIAQDIPNYGGGVTYNTHINIGGGQASGGSQTQSQNPTKTRTPSDIGKSKIEQKLDKSTTYKVNTETGEKEKVLLDNTDKMHWDGNGVSLDNPEPGYVYYDSSKHKTDYDIDKQYYAYSAASFATGGYTGEWGKEGKIAILHEKEIVLNEDDTKNMLEMLKLAKNTKTDKSNTALTSAAIETVSMAGIMSSVDRIVDKYQKMYEDSRSGMIEMNSMVSSMTKAITNNTTNNINANFPHATQYSEIEKALQNLSNATSQRLGLNRRI